MRPHPRRPSPLLLVALSAAAAPALLCDGCLTEPAPRAPAPAAGLMRVAAVQYAPGQHRRVAPGCLSAPSPDACALEHLVRRAHARGARLIVMPEYGLGDAGFDHDPALDAAPPLQRAGRPTTLGHFAALAQELGVWLVVNLETTDADTEATFNTEVALDPQGVVVAKHHKFELFHDERGNLQAGDAVSTFDTPLGPVGLLICADTYGDLRLQEQLTEALGARVVLVSAMWTARGGANWQRAFARNWGVYVVGANTTDGPGAGGGVFDPDGRTLDRRDLDAPGLVVADLPLAADRPARARPRVASVAAAAAARRAAKVTTRTDPSAAPTGSPPAASLTDSPR